MHLLYDMQNEPFLTRSQCRVSDTRVTVKARPVGLLIEYSKIYIAYVISYIRKDDILKILGKKYQNSASYMYAPLFSGLKSRTVGVFKNVQLGQKSYRPKI